MYIRYILCLHTTTAVVRKIRKKNEAVWDRKFPTKKKHVKHVSYAVHTILLCLLHTTTSSCTGRKKKKTKLCEIESSLLINKCGPLQYVVKRVSLLLPEVEHSFNAQMLKSEFKRALYSRTEWYIYTNVLRMHSPRLPPNPYGETNSCLSKFGQLANKYYEYRSAPLLIMNTAVACMVW